MILLLNLVTILILNTGLLLYLEKSKDVPPHEMPWHNWRCHRNKIKSDSTSDREYGMQRR